MHPQIIQIFFQARNKNRRDVCLEENQGKQKESLFCTSIVWYRTYWYMFSIDIHHQHTFSKGSLKWFIPDIYTSIWSIFNIFFHRKSYIFSMCKTIPLCQSWILTFLKHLLSNQQSTENYHNTIPCIEAKIRIYEFAFTWRMRKASRLSKAMNLLRLKRMLNTWPESLELFTSRRVT